MSTDKCFSVSPCWYRVQMAVQIFTGLTEDTSWHRLVHPVGSLPSSTHVKRLDELTICRVVSNHWQKAACGQHPFMVTRRLTRPHHRGTVCVVGGLWRVAMSSLVDASHCRLSDLLWPTTACKTLQPHTTQPMLTLRPADRRRKGKPAARQPFLMSQEWVRLLPPSTYHPHGTGHTSITHRSYQKPGRKTFCPLSSPSWSGQALVADLAFNRLT